MPIPRARRSIGPSSARGRGCRACSASSGYRLAFPYRWSTRAICLDKTDAIKMLGRIRRQWFAKRKSIMAILKEVMTNEASVLMDSDAANKALDADAALQELGSDLVGTAYVTATVTVWDEDPRLAEDRLRLV
jgi:type IV secretion system protein TrbE